jgi:hypothetical protein
MPSLSLTPSPSFFSRRGAPNFGTPVRRHGHTLSVSVNTPPHLPLCGKGRRAVARYARSCTWKARHCKYTPVTGQPFRSAHCRVARAACPAARWYRPDR